MKTKRLITVLGMLMCIIMYTQPVLSQDTDLEDIKNTLQFKKGEVVAVMKNVADWQIDHFKEVRHQPLGWENATMYLGMCGWAELAEQLHKDTKYYKFLNAIFNNAGWQPAKEMYNANDLCISQVYIEMYKKYGEAVMLNPTVARTEWVIRHPAVQRLKFELDVWTWCDALFMAPPVYAKLYALLGDRKYIKYMNREYIKCYNYLYDKEEHLFYRDWRYFTQREKNGEKVFWSRGNGWVMGGLCGILQALPEKDRNRKFYEKLFIEMSNRIVSLQQEDGYWHTSLLDPESFPSFETSGSGFFVYALAYGVNQGLLPAEKFMPAIKKGWKALVRAVESNGKLGYVQPVADKPFAVTREMTEVYGVGAFLLAARQIYRMSQE